MIAVIRFLNCLRCAIHAASQCQTPMHTDARKAHPPRSPCSPRASPAGPAGARALLGHECVHSSPSTSAPSAPGAAAAPGLASLTSSAFRSPRHSRHSLTACGPWAQLTGTYVTMWRRQSEVGTGATCESGGHRVKPGSDAYMTLSCASPRPSSGSVHTPVRRRGWYRHPQGCVRSQQGPRERAAQGVAQRASRTGLNRACVTQLLYSMVTFPQPSCHQLLI